MEQIDAFVNSVYRNVGGNRKEIQELQAEMKSHLLDAVHDLKSEGMSEQEAIKTAIERFGGENEIRSIVSQLFHAEKLFAKWVLYIALIFLVLSFSMFKFLDWFSDRNMQEQTIFASQILHNLENKQDVPQEIKNEVNTLVEGNNSILGVRIYYVKGIHLNEVDSIVDITKPDYEFNQMKKDDTITHMFPNFKIANVVHLGNGGGKDWYVNISIREFYNQALLILFVGVAIYWVLFAIWAIVNAYHQRRINIGWVLAFSFFNVLAFLVFRFSRIENIKNVQRF